MPLEKWQKLSSEVFHGNKWWKGIHDRFRLPNGKEGDYFYMKTPGSVFVFPIDADEKIILVRQYRYLADKESLEIVGGGIKPGRSSVDAVRAEMAEEIGIEAENLEEVGSFEPCNGLISELSHVFVARSLKPIIDHPDETEEIIIEKYSLDDFEKRIFSGEIWDGMTLAAWAIAKPYLKNSLIR